jgi:hypothetical protein
MEEGSRPRRFGRHGFPKIRRVSDDAAIHFAQTIERNNFQQMKRLSGRRTDVAVSKCRTDLSTEISDQLIHEERLRRNNFYNEKFILHEEIRPNKTSDFTEIPPILVDADLYRLKMPPTTAVTAVGPTTLN